MREILTEIERNRIRIVIRYDEDEIVIRLKLDEAKQLSGRLKELLLDFEERKGIRID